MFNKEIKEGNKITAQNKILSELTKHHLKMIQMELLEMKTVITEMTNLIDKSNSRLTEMRR